MDIGISWVQFLSSLVIATFTYAVFVVAKFHPRLLHRCAFWKQRDRSRITTNDYSDYAPDNIMGGVRPSRYVRNTPAKILPVIKPSDSIPADMLPEEEEEEVLVMSLQSIAPPEELPNGAAIDLDQLSEIIDRTASLVGAHADGSNIPQAESAKSQLMDVIAADLSLSTTDFARQIAATLDNKVSTPPYSDVEPLQTAAA